VLDSMTTLLTKAKVHSGDNFCTHQSHRHDLACDREGPLRGKHHGRSKSRQMRGVGGC
jgi:hypothetical protein